MHRFSNVSLFLRALFMVSTLAGYSYGEAVGAGYRIGTSVNVMRDPESDAPFFGLAIPQIEYDAPIAGRYLQFELGWGVQWGLTKFYIDHFPDFLPSLGLRLYPAGKIVSIFGNGSWGTFVFNNSTLTAEAGLEFDIPVGHVDGLTSCLALGASVFYREINGLGDFVDGRQWWFTKEGIGIRVGFRGRILESVGDWE